MPSCRSMFSVLLHTGQFVGRLCEDESSLVCLLGTGTTCAESFAVGRSKSSTISWRASIGFTDVSESSFLSDVVGGQGCSLPSLSIAMLLPRQSSFVVLLQPVLDYYQGGQL